ncbi:MAG: hypothetical protein ABI707_00015 [Ferruginibacter sp.]
MRQKIPVIPVSKIQTLPGKPPSASHRKFNSSSLSLNNIFEITAGYLIILLVKWLGGGQLTGICLFTQAILITHHSLPITH